MNDQIAYSGKMAQVSPAVVFIHFPYKPLSGMGGLTVASVEDGRSYKQAGFPFGYVGGEAGRPGTPTADKEGGLFSGGGGP